MVVLHVTVAAALGLAAVEWPTSGALQRAAAFVVLVVPPLVWAGLDSLRDDALDDDPDERSTLNLGWLKAALAAGPVAGLLSWAVQAVFIDKMGASELLGSIIGGGAFTALLIYLPATVGLVLGRLARGRSLGRTATADQ